ncbi:DUF2723 domain-containing protein [Mucilaginibacter robiniae]|uniref:DUF2723 domain-containing protein n=1 Tax=Mucilaginibacter robiniae TaxID=2728022 RepID=A0A7L5E551_9SPHI|nr:DUF2723 domain-containing protein [Mucilaginibacter robiniae]QJD97748.1 DUF2723 domain-containing protein [Mucilaginibacter robiniae]
MHYHKINNLLGWFCFAIAAITYILTLEPSVSFWDCGEFISCAYRLQVSHQPGYPLFAMIGKAFSLLSMSNKAKVPYFTNMSSALASAATVMFLFWTITALAKKLLVKKDESISQGQLCLIMGAGIVGALAFSFTDTFWFSAVETIVFAWAALCVAVVVWAMLKWDAHADEPGADRYLVLIAYVMGLSIGIHLLNLLTIPALTFIYYFRRSKKISTKNTLIALSCGITLLALVQFGIIQYTVKLAAYFDLFFVNTLHLNFGSGVLVFLLLLVGALVTGIVYSIRKNKPVLNLALVCITFIYLGYSSFAMIPIRAHAGTNLNNYHPDNAFVLQRYLNRVQYIAPPLLYGPYFDAQTMDQKDGAPIYRKGKNTYEIVGKEQKLIYDHNTILPRIYSNDGQDPLFYKQWLQLADGQTPTFKDNLSFLFSWQIYQMYFRYFLWNFVGRYNDSDGQTSTTNLNGNWTSGWFDSSKHLPKSVIQNNTYTPLYALPLLIGLLGAVYHFRQNKKDASVIALLYFFMGIAIVLYVNQPSVQPRERDYSYIGSFYAFAIWIGLGVLAIAQLIQKKLKSHYAALAATVICVLAAPVLMANQEWKNHDRSTKLTPHDMAYNYLNSCEQNAILFTYGDNDTYPLWYIQEVEGVRPDVRLVNLSLFSADWNIRQMKHSANQAAALPITMNDDLFKEGVRDYLTYQDAKLPDSVELKDIFDFLISDNNAAKLEYSDGTHMNYLPTKHFKLTVNANEVIKNGALPSRLKNHIVPVMEWQYPSNAITKDQLALMDILVHNHWKRPIYFTNSAPDASILGLRSYLYNEGFAYHLLPIKADTTQAETDQTNTLVMYQNIMNKFKWGNMKQARYLDEQSTHLFYPFIISTFANLSQNLLQEGHTDLARKTLSRYNQVMPDLYPYIDVAARKVYMADTACHLQDFKLANQMLTSVDGYLKDQLDYNYHQLQNHADTMNMRDVQIGLSLLNDMASLASNYHQLTVGNQLKEHLEDYKSKFAILFKQ